MNTTLEFYDNLADSYHLIATDWDSAVKSQGHVLYELIANRFPQISSVSVLDCSCGIGTQAIGLALKGYQVHATDLSSKAVKQARQQADRLGAKLTFGVADFRTLSRDVDGTFEVVISCDNSLPHLLNDHDFAVAASNIFGKLKPGGIFIASIRDYDEMLKTKPSGMVPKRVQDQLGERIYTQAWTWSADTNQYEVELFLLLKSETGWKTQSYKTEYRAIQREELSSFLKQAGFTNVEWSMPNNSSYYQPIVIAHRPGEII